MLSLSTNDKNYIENNFDEIRAGLGQGLVDSSAKGRTNTLC